MFARRGSFVSCPPTTRTELVECAPTGRRPWDAIFGSVLAVNIHTDPPLVAAVPLSVLTDRCRDGALLVGAGWTRDGDGAFALRRPVLDPCSPTPEAFFRLLARPFPLPTSSYALSLPSLSLRSGMPTSMPTPPPRRPTTLPLSSASAPLPKRMNAVRPVPPPLSSVLLLLPLIG